MNYTEKIIIEIENHCVEGIRECFENGVGPNDYFNNEPLIYELITEYLRSPRFKTCVQAFVDYGLNFDNKTLLAVLLDNAALLEEQLEKNPGLVNKRYTIRCAFTPLHEATLLHICAEFNHVACAETLIKHGADVNAKAATDENGFGGQTPIFHTVNQLHHFSSDILDLLLSKSADLDLTIKGVIWGKGYEWETFIPSVNPISYAMMGLLPQMHRNELVISKVITLLLKAEYGIDFKPPNVPNQYLKTII